MKPLSDKNLTYTTLQKNNIGLMENTGRLF